MSDDTPTIEEADELLVAAIEHWWRANYEDGGPSVLRSWYLIAVGTGFDSDGDQTTHIGQRYEADLIAQLGMAAYLGQRVAERMDYIGGEG